MRLALHKSAVSCMPVCACSCSGGPGVTHAGQGVLKCPTGTESTESINAMRQVLVETTGGGKYTAFDAQRMLQDLNNTQQARMTSMPPGGLPVLSCAQDVSGAARTCECMRTARHEQPGVCYLRWCDVYMLLCTALTVTSAGGASRPQHMRVPRLAAFVVHVQ